MCRSMVDIQSATAEIRRGIKKEDRRKKLQGKNTMSASATQGGHNKAIADITLRPLCCICLWVYALLATRHGPLSANMTSPKQPEVHKHMALSSEKDWATDSGNTHRKYREVWTRRSWDMRANTHTYRHRSSQYFALHPYRGRTNQLNIWAWFDDKLWSIFKANKCEFFELSSLWNYEDLCV